MRAFRGFILLSLLSLTFLPLTFSAHAAVRYVKPDAPGPTHDGTTWQTAFQQVSDAVTSAAAGDEIWIAAGDYAGGVILKPGLSLYGGFVGTETDRAARQPDINRTVLDGGGSKVVLSAATPGPATVLDGLVVQNGAPSNIYCENTALTVNRCRITGSTGDGVLSDFGGQITVSHCVVTDNAGDGVAAFQSDALVRNSLVARNGNGIVCSLLSVMFLDNNTVVRNTETGVGAFIYSTIEATNNIVVGNATGVAADVDNPSSVIMYHNDVFGNASNFAGMAAPGASTGNISKDPLFVNPDAGDYHLQPLSPAIDAGRDTVASDGATDLEGKPRIQGPHVDMGVYEYAAFASLVFTTQPAGAAAGSQLAVQPVVTVQDKDGNTLADYDGPITLSIKSGPAGAALSGNVTAMAANGVATFTNLVLSKGGTNYVLLASGRGLISGASQAFVVKSPVVRVRPGGSDDNDGSTWALAKRSVQAGLAQAMSPNGEVWVAAGDYAGQFTVPSGVKLLGGFAGQEVTSAQRDFTRNISRLQGTGGSVVTIADAAVDGFTITGGTSGATHGGGIVCLMGAPSIRNNIITQNTIWSADAATYGGGVYCKGSGWVIEGNTVTDNVAQHGGGIYAEGTGRIAENTVKDNVAKARGESEPGSGGGIACLGNSIALTANTVEGNTADPGEGGGLWANGTGLTVSFNTVSDNTAGAGGGGGMLLSGSGVIHGNSVTRNTAAGGGGGIAFSRSFTLTSNVLAGNNSGASGGGVLSRSAIGSYFNNTVVDNSAPEGGGISGGSAFSNNIVVGNSSGIQGGSAFRNNDVYGNASYDYSATDPTGINGNIKADPQFVDRAGGDYRLRDFSPVIDRGYDAVVAADATDRDRNPRIVGPHVDLGAYEFPVSLVPGTTPATYLAMHSVGSDWVGGGQNYLLGPVVGGQFSINASDSTQDGVVDSVSISYDGGNVYDKSGHWFHINFNTYRVPANLVPGEYLEAQRAPFTAAGHPGIDIGGDGRGCNTICGKFTVLEAVYDYTTNPIKVLRLAINFEQHCECGGGYLTGTFAYNSTVVPAPYTMTDVRRAMAMTAGILTGEDAESRRLNVDKFGASANTVDTQDVVTLLRKVLGRDYNP